ncbi:hypothetical protein [Glycomyces paridis]|uniref:Uncharacterized protein n=1 Tax=Glycomyces paridis TaxID=2126555 RepID=A0A4S8PHP6_9ACTN|nr:hypothetical protein [Glycomyces paridis]THV30100.1 hypothetical protein E9998_06900 [Glycomyces paridis]
MSRTPRFDLKLDGPVMLERQWLEPGERLIEWAPVWRLPELDGIAKPPWTSEQVARRVWKVVWLTLAWVLGSVVLLIVLAIIGDGLSGASADGPSGKRKGPNVVLRGGGGDSIMGRLVTPALRCRGVWAFTNRRIAFVEVTGRTYGRFLSGSGEPSDFEGPWPVRTLVEVREGGYEYEGAVDRMRCTRILRRFKPAGVYRRITFADGSGVDLRKRR